MKNYSMTPEMNQVALSEGNLSEGIQKLMSCYGCTEHQAFLTYLLRNTSIVDSFPKTACKMAYDLLKSFSENPCYDLEAEWGTEFYPVEDLYAEVMDLAVEEGRIDIVESLK